MHQIKQNLQLCKDVTRQVPFKKVMSSIITAILRSIVSLLRNKAHCSTANDLNFHRFPHAYIRNLSSTAIQFQRSVGKSHPQIDRNPNSGKIFQFLRLDETSSCFNLRLYCFDKVMSSIITAILRSTVDILCDKARDSAANKLKDGDLADEKLREIIVKDLTDIKSKLDCLSLKDLDSSYSFLKEGVTFLNAALDKSSDGEKASERPSNEATRVVNDSASGVLNTVLSLSRAIERLKISSEKHVVSAEDCFKASRETATHAFNNKSLSIKDRIMACKLRVAARILESGLDEPDAATTACLLSLEELHGLPAIQEMFAVFFKGGLKSMFKKAERLENIKSVLSINHALYDFASQYCSESHYLFTWPVIELRGSTFHPVLSVHEVFEKTSSSEEFVPQLNRVVVDPRIFGTPFAVNSRGDITLLTEDKITIIYSTGESKDVMFPEPTETNVVGQWANDVAVDSNDNAYAVRRLDRYDENDGKRYDFVFYVFDQNYNIKHVSVLDFLDAGALRYMKIAVDKNQNLYMITNWNNQVYVCDNAGKLKFKFERDGDDLRSMSISNNNDVMIVSHDLSAVQIYTTEGNLKSTIKVPEGHKAWSVAFHYGTCKIIVLTYVQKQISCFILSYSETGELENSVFFRKGNIDIKTHPSGQVVVVIGKTITFI